MHTERVMPLALLLFMCLAIGGCASDGRSAVDSGLPTTSPGLWRPTATITTMGRSLPTAPVTAQTAALPAPTATLEPQHSQPIASPVTLGRTLPVVTATKTAVASGSEAMDVQSLQQHLLELINRDRTQNGLAPVTWDPVAARAGGDHSTEMAATCAMSHWNRAGYGPDVRYTLAGGLDSVMENVFQYWHSAGGGPRTAQDWLDLMAAAETSWMQSAGHRANILAPEHTGVGVGIAYAAATGCLALTQEFVNHYVTMEPAPLEARVGDTVQVRGRLAPGATDPLISMAWEPLSEPMTVEQLKQTSTYASPANIYESAQPKSGTGGVFELAVRLDNGGRPGLYHIRVWVNTAHGQVMAADRAVFVR